MVLLFCGSVALLAVVIFGYGAVIIVMAKLLPARPRSGGVPVKATLLIAAHNEEDCIGAKLANSLAQEVAPHRLSVMVVSDGSSDRTVEIARRYGVAVLEIREHVGKIPAMNLALAGITDEVVIFSDANSQFAPGALKNLLDGFADPAVGGVCGSLAISRRRGGWLGRAERLYWRYDNALKMAESRLGGAVSAQGSLYAVRRTLVPECPPSVADDFFISTAVVVAGKRLSFEPAAVTEEPVSSHVRAEFGRRVRSTERGWRGLLMRRALLNPFRHGVYALQLLFHKLLRRMVPLLLALLFPVSAALASQHWFYTVVFGAQLAIYSGALAAALWPAVRRIPGSSLPFFFVGAQLAMAMGLVRVALGRHSSRWKPARST